MQKSFYNVDKILKPVGVLNLESVGIHLKNWLPKPS